MLWVRSDQGIEQHSRSFNITNFGIGFYDDVFERGEVPFGVDGRRGTRGSRCAGDLKNYQEYEIESQLLATYLVEFER